MNKVKIKENRHRPLSIIPPFMRNIRFDRKGSQIIGYELLFDESCEYLLDNGDQYDWNKLYGWGFGLNHHEDSVRLVWRYNLIEKVIEVAPYLYIEGKKTMPTKEQIIKVKIGEKIKTSIEVLDNIARVIIETDKCYPFEFIFDISVSNKPLLGCWFYFGGNRKATHDITIRYNKNKGAIATLLRY